MINQLFTSTKFSLLSFRRNPAATFFTVVFPVVLLVLFGLLFGNYEVASGAKTTTFQVPGILAMSVVSATFVNLAMDSVYRRETGQLKRIRSTPISPLVYVMAQVLSSAVLVVFMCALVIGVGRLLFGVSFQMQTIGVFVLSLILGTACFSALGLAISAVIPSFQAASAITNLIVLPLYFVSEVFVHTEQDVAVLSFIGSIFPIKHFNLAIRDSFNPFLEGSPLPVSHWVVLLVWGVFGAFMAARFFKWTPRSLG